MKTSVEEAAKSFEEEVDSTSFAEEVLWAKMRLWSHENRPFEVTGLRMSSPFSFSEIKRLNLNYGKVEILRVGANYTITYTPNGEIDESGPWETGVLMNVEAKDKGESESEALLQRMRTAARQILK